MNFFDPQLTNDGKPFGPLRYKQLVQQCYAISKNCNTSYNDVLQMTPTERDYLIEFLTEEAKKQQEDIEKLKQRNKTK